MKEYKKAVFAGGCFWCMEHPFDELSGVVKVLPGYTGGSVANPTYEQVCTGRTGHLEAVEVTYDPELVSYKQLLDVFWRQIDPTDENGQFADRGGQYQSAVFYADEEQKHQAVVTKEALEASGKFDKKIKTRLLPAAVFYPAESYHCRYYEKNPEHYGRYRKGSGREDYIKRTWKED